MRSVFVAGLALLALAGATPAGAIVLNPVLPDRRAFDPAAGEAVRVRFRIDTPAHVTLRIWDARDLLVNAIESAGALPAGEHALQWDGTDAAGELVPVDAYHFTLEARDEAGKTVLHDLTDSTGGEVVAIEALRWDPADGRIHYLAPTDSRVSIRVGLTAGGPLLRTIVDWAARPGGTHAEAWDGKDVSGVLDLREHPKLEVSAHAFSLPDNTLYVGTVTETTSPSWIAFQDTPPQRPSKRERRPRSFADQPAESRRDVTIALSIVDHDGELRDGRPVVSGPARIQLEIPDAGERERLLAERFEVVFFVDGIFRFENEVGFLPTSWRWDADTSAPGVHYVTANLLGYGGNFGTATLALEVEKAEVE